jgi:hypothetical protein
MAETQENKQDAGIDFYLVAEATSTLFATSMFLAVFKIWRDGAFPIGYYAVALSVPALASMTLLGLGLSFPSLFAVRKIAFPLNLTLPLIHVSLMAVFMELIQTGIGLIRLPETLQGVTLWANPRMLFLSMFAQFLVLSALGLLRIPPPKEPAPPVESR